MVDYWLPKSLYDISDWIEEKLKEEDNRKKVSKFCIYLGAGLVTGMLILKIMGVFA